VIDIPSARWMLVGAALRRYREGLGYGLEDAARILRCDRSKISRIETGQRGIRPLDLQVLLMEYGVVGEPEQATLTAIAGPRRVRSLQKDFAGLAGGAVEDFLLVTWNLRSVSLLGVDLDRIVSP
jgi:transcriptional regulator with XRE-family HTH domain